MGHAAVHGSLGCEIEGVVVGSLVTGGVGGVESRAGLPAAAGTGGVVHRNVRLQGHSAGTGHTDHVEGILVLAPHALDAEEVFPAVGVIILAGLVVGGEEVEDTAVDYFQGLVIGFLIGALVQDGIARLGQVHLGQQGLDGAFGDAAALVVPRHARAFHQALGSLEVTDDLGEDLGGGGQRELRIVEAGGGSGLERHGAVVADQVSVVETAEEIHFAQIAVAACGGDVDIGLVLQDIDHRIDIVEAAIEGAPGSCREAVLGGNVAVQDFRQLSEGGGGTLGVAAEHLGHHDDLAAGVEPRRVEHHAGAEVRAVGAHPHLLLVGVIIVGLLEGLGLFLEEVRAGYSQNQCGCDCHDFIKVSFHRAHRFRK